MALIWPKRKILHKEKKIGNRYVQQLMMDKLCKSLNAIWTAVRFRQSNSILFNSIVFKEAFVVFIQPVVLFVYLVNLWCAIHYFSNKTWQIQAGYKDDNIIINVIIIIVFPTIVIAIIIIVFFLLSFAFYLGIDPTKDDLMCRERITVSRNRGIKNNNNKVFLLKKN